MINICDTWPDNNCIDLNVQNDKVDQSTIGIRCQQLNIKPLLIAIINQFFFYLLESSETETNLKVATFGIHLKTCYFVHVEQFALNRNANKFGS